MHIKRNSFKVWNTKHSSIINTTTLDPVPLACCWIQREEEKNLSQNQHMWIFFFCVSFQCWRHNKLARKRGSWKEGDRWKMVAWLCVRVPEIGINPCLTICITKLSPGKKYLPGSLCYRTVNVSYFCQVSCAFVFVYFWVQSNYLYKPDFFFFFKACRVGSSMALLFPPYPM